MRLSSGKILFSNEGGVAQITLNRPEVLNAMDSEMHLMMSDIWNYIRTDSKVRVVVIEGTGGRAFSVGQDLKESSSLAQQDQASTYGSKGRPGHPRFTQRFDINKPVIAKVDGYALGGGFELALASDIIIASSSSTFGLPEVKRGLVPGAGGVFRMMRQFPCKLAMGYLLTGKHLSAQVAQEFGLVNDVVDCKELDVTVRKWINALLEASPLAIASVKEAAYKSMDLSLPESFVESFSEESNRMKGQDHIEGPRAFIEKRLPSWCQSTE
ncbi:enoyl-CoA hydratase-related protein [Pseudoalteromonas umbrosa]|uniref:enoyl-CoA hydratase-related protein n=1 Tax=Pseudoalteromonas umbrosa TaxID=3048489 RepID=UPI0024C21838|nr:enoyl-CoA hydratase-related protein [Pseudoalteromonas sp. B95]MDK1288841.1 enoyl-CoA hydratase-related protein [Pseudoalteromonas sp. B95]